MDDLIYSLHYMSTINILHWSHAPQCRARVDKRFEGYYVLQLMTRGAIDLTYDADEHHLSGCWFFTAFPGPHTTFHSAPGTASWHHRHVAFTGPQVQHWVAEGIFFHAPQPGDARRHGAAFDALLEAAAAPGQLSQRCAANLLENLLLELAAQRTARDSQDDWLQRVLCELDADSGRDRDYGQLARKVGLSVSTLRRRFLQATGMSIHHYVIEARVARARHQLQHTDLPVKAIAEQLGYRDVYFFSRQFKQRVGLAPATFRRSL